MFFSGIAHAEETTNKPVVMVRSQKEAAALKAKGTSAEAYTHSVIEPIPGWPLKRDRVKFLSQFIAIEKNLKKKKYDDFSTDLFISQLANKKYGDESLIKKYPFLEKKQLKQARAYLTQQTFSKK